MSQLEDKECGRNAYQPSQSSFLELFVLSESGKPIYSYSKREDIFTLLPLCQALLNCFQDTLKDTIRYIITKSGLKIIFSHRSPLIFVAVTHVFSGIDGNILVNQIHAQIVSVITDKTLHSVFEQRATFDLRRLLTGNEKMVHILIEQGFILKPTICWSSQPEPVDVTKLPSMELLQMVNDDPHTRGYLCSSASYQRNHANRAMIPIYPMVRTVRDSVTNAILSSISAGKSKILFGILMVIEPDEKGNSEEDLIRTKSEKYPHIRLMSIANVNSKSAKLNPLDLQLIECLVMALQVQLFNVESLWLPLCLPRIDCSAFMHGHISNLNQTSAPSYLCLVLLTSDKEDFHNCQVVKNNLSERLNRIKLNSSPLAELNLPCIQFFWYMNQRFQSVFRHSYPSFDVIKLSHLIHYMASRMISSRLKMFWFRSDYYKIVLLGWHTSTFQLYVQLDGSTSKSMSLSAAHTIIKWIKEEEHKLALRDYI
ncbi:vacuolar fusion protein MON1 homolog isoform X1 [Brevipalpus obovatus]|uniref:vacuolar fusion protein MON1 homolog isoform X1 n=2 Tax=Brevipalpus obovatus TaxID=246614 RepID=UPI003D9F47F6